VAAGDLVRDGLEPGGKMRLAFLVPPLHLDAAQLRPDDNAFVGHQHDREDHLSERARHRELGEAPF
jgi:hypothetical protein